MTSLLRKTTVLVLWALFLGGSVWSQQTVDRVPAELISYPDLIVYNGKIVTMEDASLSNAIGRTLQAMAVRGDRIQFLGSSQEILRYAGPQTRKIDLQGRTVIPGMIDTHNHIHNVAVRNWAQKNPQKIESIAKSFSVTGKNYAELTKGIELVLKEQMAHPLPGQWAMISLGGGGAGTGLGVQYLFDKGITREQLDKLAPILPVYVGGGGFATNVMNTAARNDFLQFYAVEPTDENEERIINPQIDRALISERYFDTHLSELADIVEDTLRHQAAGGYTTYSSHIVGLKFMPAFRKLVVEGRMPMRFGFTHRYCQQVLPDNASCFLRIGDWQGLGDKYYWNVGATMGAIDGGPPAFCTTMEGPVRYKSQEVCNIVPGNTYYEAIYTALRSRYRYVVNHDYGDKSLDQFMDIIDRVMKDNPDITLDFIRSQRITTDHCGFYPRKEQLPRIKHYGMMISCDPRFLNRSEPWLGVYGKQYANRIAPFKSILDAGIMVTAEMGQSYNLGLGEGPTPAAELLQMVTRVNARNVSVAPEEAVDRSTALKTQTVWASYYVLKEKEIGTLEPGKLADFIVLNKDWFTVPDQDFGTIFPLMTVLGGKTIVLREEFAKELGVAAVGPQIKFEFKATYDFGDPLKPESGMD